VTNDVVTSEVRTPASPERRGLGLRGAFARLNAAAWPRLAALGKLSNTTAFKLTLVYLTVFALFAAMLLGYFAWNTRRLITEQITRTVDAEITGLSEQYNQGGIRRLVFIIDSRARRPGSSLYLVTTHTGDGLAGNVGLLGEGVLEQAGWTETVYRGSASTTSFSPRGNGRSRWSSCWGSPAESSSHDACCTASTP
jgi:hypothetical protein